MNPLGITDPQLVRLAQTLLLDDIVLVLLVAVASTMILCAINATGLAILDAIRERDKK